MVNYPAALPSLTPADHKAVNDELVAIGTELGLNLRGAFADVAARLGGFVTTVPAGITPTALQSAVDAAASGAVLWLYGAYSVANLSISKPLTLAGFATLTKAANGPAITITAQGVKIGKGITVGGNAPTYTGPGVVVTGTGTTSDLEIDGDVVGSQQWAIDVGVGAAQRGVFRGLLTTTNTVIADAALTAGSTTLTSATANFTAGDVGKAVLVAGGNADGDYHLSQIVSVESVTSCTLLDPAGATVTGKALEAHFPCIRFGAEVSAGVNGDREIVGVRTAGYILADLGGVVTVSIVGCNIRGLIFPNNLCTKLAIVGCRIAPSGGQTIVRGYSHSITGNVMSGDLVIDAGANNNTVADNAFAVGKKLINRGPNNRVDANIDAQLMPHTLDPRLLSSTQVLNASQAVFERVRGKGTITKVGVHVAVSSGNVCVGVYGNNGSAGSAARPATRKATSGSVVCPIAGYAEITVPSVNVEEGDWLAIVSDNATASFYRAGAAGFTTGIATGLSHHQNAAFPLPATAAAVSGAAFSVILTGVV